MLRVRRDTRFSRAIVAPRAGSRATIDLPENRLFVGNLDQTLNELAVIKLFEPFGPLHHVQYMWHLDGPMRGQPRGFCFIEYKKHEDATRAVEMMNGRVVVGRSLVVKFARERSLVDEVQRRQERLRRQSDTTEVETSRKLAKLVVPNTVSTDRRIALLERQLRRAGASCGEEDEQPASVDAAELAKDADDRGPTPSPPPPPPTPLSGGIEPEPSPPASPAANTDQPFESAAVRFALAVPYRRQSQ